MVVVVSSSRKWCSIPMIVIVTVMLYIINHRYFKTWYNTHKPWVMMHYVCCCDKHLPCSSFSESRLLESLVFLSTRLRLFSFFPCPLSWSTPRLSKGDPWRRTHHRRKWLINVLKVCKWLILTETLLWPSGLCPECETQVVSSTGQAQHCNQCGHK